MSSRDDSLEEQALDRIITRSYLADPEGTARDLDDIGDQHPASWKVDYESGRLASNYATLTGRRIRSEPASVTCGGALITPVMHTEVPGQGELLGFGGLTPEKPAR